jgi:capsular exopolysaccharide synthesis family protein
MLTAKEGNPLLKNIDLQLGTVRSDMIKNLRSQQKDLFITQNKFEAENRKINEQIASLPSTERTYINFSREREVKQALYLFLLQQKEQAAISKASTISNATIIDGPKSEYRYFTPNKKIIYLLGVIAAFLVTLFWIFIKRIFNNKVNSKNDLQKLTDCPIIGEIGHSTHNGIIIDEDGRSVISEQFRQLRTNLSFVLGNNKCSKIVITSSISGEGKSFMSFNLALIYARAQKKVLLIEMDLRKPKLSKLLNIDNSKGYTTFTVNNGDINNYINKLPHNEYLHFLSSGPIPPNPAELLMSPSTTKMFEELSNNFDLIIIDTPPLGLVADAQIISNYSDTILYLSRCNFSLLKSLETVNEFHHNKKLSNLYLVLNDIKKNNGDYGYGYGYGYGSGYGYGNDEVEKKKSLFKKLFGFKKRK